MTPPRFDLQAHSLHSDGELSPAEVVAAAAAAGIELLALTDHDTVDGVDEARDAAHHAGLRVVPATELSAVDEGHEDLHILGYGIDHCDLELARALSAWRADRDQRIQRMVGRLRTIGLEVADAELEHRRAAGKPIGRPHLARAVLDAPANGERLAAEGIDDVPPLIERYLVPGAAAYVPRTTPSVPEAIAALHAAGGVAVWAHPFWDVADTDEVLGILDRFAAAGIDGVEAFYITHTRAQTLALVEAAGRAELLTTGSADFHGPSHRRFSRFGAFELFGATPVLGPIADYGVG